MKLIILLLAKILLFPHIILYFLCANREYIDDDIEVMNTKLSINYKKTTALVYYLLRNKYYRNIFYVRIGRKSALVSWLLPGDSTFFPCRNIKGGVYAAHPYATVLNAQSIGKNFSFRNCTTIGNKKDGEWTKGPIIGNNVQVGANVCIIGNIHIGDNVIIGAGSVVVKDVPDNVVIAGNPATIIRKFS